MQKAYRNSLFKNGAPGLFCFELVGWVGGGGGEMGVCASNGGMGGRGIKCPRDDQD